MKLRNFTPTMAAICFLMAFTTLGIGESRAQEGQPKLTIQMDVTKEAEVRKDGKWVTEKIPVETSQKGDILFYTVTYQNDGDTAATDAVIVDPIPVDTVYILDSTGGEGADVLFSVDGGHFYQPPPAKYIIRNVDGTREEIIAPPEMYTHIKWHIQNPVPPGQSGQLYFRVRVK
ncbi:hypothetical protein ACFL9U_13440 [Thermodesulfobacteriota bacterium]